MDLYRADALLSATLSADRPIAFLIGSPLSSGPDGQGVPGVGAMLDIVREEVKSWVPARLAQFEEGLEDRKGTEAYQYAMAWLHANVNQRAVNNVVRRATLRACLDPAALGTNGELEDGDPSLWHLPPGTQALGRLIAARNPLFPGPILTTNFDPLLSLAIRAAGGSALSHVLDADGDFAGVHPPSGTTTIIHLHGYWRGSDTLHNPRQLVAERRRLTASLQQLLRKHTLLVVAYGGWDDVFTTSLVELVQDRGAQTDVMWCFYEDDPALITARYGRLLSRVQPAVTRGNFRIYGDIDCHRVLPALADAVAGAAPAQAAPPAPAPAAAPAAGPPPLPAVPAEPPGTGRMEPPRFPQIPRHATLRALASHVAANPVVAVEGLPGAGKTYLVSELAHQTAAGGAAVLWHEPAAGESLDVLLGAVQAVLPLTGSAPPARCRSLLHVLKERGMRLVIDDFQIVDQHSYAVLLEAATGHGHPGAVVLLSTRFVNPSLKARIAHFQLSGFGRDEVRECLRDRGFRNPGGALVDELITRTGALPQAVSLFATLVVGLGRPPHRLLSGGMIQHDLLQSWYGEIAASLGDEARRLLQAVSLSEVSFNRGVMLALGRHAGIREVEDAFEQLLRLYLVQGYRTYQWRVHPLIAAFATAGMSEDERRRIHLVLAQRFLNRLPRHRGRLFDPEALDDAVRACGYLQLAGAFGRAERIIHEIVHTAKAQGAYDLLMRLCRIQMERHPGRDPWIDYHYAHGAVIKGRLLDAESILAPLHQKLRQQGTRLALAVARLYAECLHGLGDSRTALEVLRTGMSGTAAVQPGSVVWAQARGFEAQLLIHFGELDAARPIVEDLVATAVKRGDELGSAVALTLWGTLALRTDGTAQALQRLEQALELFKRCDDHRGMAWTLSHLSRAHLQAGDAARAQDELAEMLRLRAEISECSPEYHDFLLALPESVTRGPLAKQIARELQRTRQGLQLRPGTHI